MGRTPTSFSMPDLENGKVPNKYFGAYDNLFRAFYSEKLDLDDTNIATVLSGAMALIDVAESVGSAEIIRESVDIALLRQGQVLYRSIGANALAWVDLGRRLQSPTIFKEALIHLVGQWNAIDIRERGQLETSVREICERKHAELDITKQGMEMRMLGHYPGFLRRNIAETGHVGRTTYANDIYMWMTVALFRQWFAQNICENRNLTAADGGAYMYRQISAGGSAYLDHTKLATFHQYFPMSPKAKNVLENHMNSLKAELQIFPGELLKNRSQIDDSHDPLPYLTCAVIEKSDFPWTPKIPVIPATAPKPTTGSKRRYEDMDEDSDEDFGYLGSSSAVQTNGHS
jgi:hypothetical protein